MSRAEQGDPMLRTESAGALMVVAVTHPNGTVRRYAQQAAQIAAEHGTERARGFLHGVWYDGGNAVIPGEDIALTYGDVVAVLQGALGIQIVAPR